MPDAIKPMTDVDAEDSAAICRLVKREIEALVELPPYYSRTAYTARLTHHVIIHNGEARLEGDNAQPTQSLLVMGANSVAAAKRLREVVPGRVALVWRAEPQIGERGDLYMRLCFEEVEPPEPNAGFTARLDLQSTRGGSIVAEVRAYGQVEQCEITLAADNLALAQRKVADA